jgi:hypothetical protein
VDTAVKRRAIWAVVIAAVVIVAAVPIVYFSLRPGASPCATPSGDKFRFTPVSLRPNGTIVMALQNPTLVSVAPLTQSNASVAIAVLWSNPGSSTPNSTLSAVTGELRSAGVAPLGYVAPGPSALEDVKAYAAAGLAGIYVPPAATGAVCSPAEIISYGHEQGGFVAQGISEPELPGPLLPDVNLTILTTTEFDWTPAVVRESIPYTSSTAVVVLNESRYLTLFTVGSFHSIGLHYFLVANGTNGTQLLPVSNQLAAYQAVYQGTSLLPFDWLYHASYPLGAVTDGRAYSAGNFYALTETDDVPSGGDAAVIVNQTLLFLNLTYGDPFAPPWTYSYTVPPGELTDVNHAVSVQNGLVYAVDAYLYLANQTGLGGWNLSIVASVANASSGAPLIQTEHKLLVSFPPSSQTSPFAVAEVSGEFVTVITPLAYYSSGDFQLWVSVFNALTGDEVNSEDIPVAAVGENLSGWSMNAGHLGPYTYAFGSVALINGSEEPFTVLMNQTGQTVFEFNGTPTLLLAGNALYFLGHQDGSVEVMAYFLGNRTLDSLADLGPISNLTGAVLPADGLYIVETVNGTYFAFSPAGAKVWEIQLPLNELVAYPVAPTILPGDRIIIGTILDEYTVEVTQYSQEFLLMNATSGEPLAWFNYSFTITPMGSPPALPPNLPPEYGSISMVGGMIQAWAWYGDVYYFSPLSVVYSMG